MVVKMGIYESLMMEYYYSTFDAWEPTESTKTRVNIYSSIKHLIERLLALALLILLTPLFVLLALLIQWDSPGPVLFRQERIGKGGKPFKFFKFRSMRSDIDRGAHEAFFKAFVNGHTEGSEQLQEFKPIQDDQVTRMGRFLRKTSLDELPQLLNIIKGEMSFIGPRPNVLAEVEAYKDWHRRRLEVLPGITGLAQINGRSSIPFDQIVQYDIEYVENESLLLDLQISWQTLPAVLRGKGAK
jgi:lipopolysaccharide/colanic/teichoic acid biosynthesis glycosyltransferase